MIGPDPMTAFYAAVEAVRGGDVGEVTLDYTDNLSDGTECRLEITVRREPRRIIVSPITEEDQ